MSTEQRRPGAVGRPPLLAFEDREAPFVSSRALSEERTAACAQGLVEGGKLFLASDEGTAPHAPETPFQAPGLLPPSTRVHSITDLLGR